MRTVLVEDAGGVRTITLNRPDRRNALLPEMQDAVTEALREQASSKTRIVVLRGAGEAFCAGLDIAVLRDMASWSADRHRAEADRVARMFGALWECDLPTVAVVQGAAVAGGTGLATMCDFTLAAPEARFGYTEARIGFVPALVSAYLRLQVGDKASRGLLLSGRLFGADEALRLGLVSDVIPREDLDARTAALCADLMRNSPQSLQATKRLLRSQNRAWLAEALTLATEANAAARETADFREGVHAFLEKRPPVWQG